ncbi:hypothetical protein [uncultured Enterococcus sp.]|uniref:hypothetical protein n=1 Tax=uncultured Enterococcus sp. TaxID=167972 RepID=UPI002AA808EC|nr:hypothetical protein [uncultured Enterococcus sp.]
MITPAYPNQRKNKTILIELQKQLIEYPHYIYFEKGKIFSKEQPKITNPEEYYKVFKQSRNTVLFWSSKTPLHSTKAIYEVKNQTILFEKVIDMAQEDAEWVGRNLCLAALGIKLVLKEEVDWVQLPRIFMPMSHPKVVIEGDFVRIKIKDL